MTLYFAGARTSVQLRSRGNRGLGAVPVVAHVHAAHAVTAWPTHIVMLGEGPLSDCHSVPESRTTIGQTFTLLGRLV